MPQRGATMRFLHSKSDIPLHMRAAFWRIAYLTPTSHAGHTSASAYLQLHYFASYHYFAATSARLSGMNADFPHAIEALQYDYTVT